MKCSKGLHFFLIFANINTANLWLIYCSKSRKYKIKPAGWRTIFDLSEKKSRFAGLEAQTHYPDFWKDHQKSVEITKEISNLKDEIAFWEEVEMELNDLSQLSHLAEADENLQKDIEQKIEKIGKWLKKEEFRIFLSGKYDKGSAIITIYSGAGGQDAQDWATMLLRMYERYCQSRGFRTIILHQTFGEGGGPEGRIGTKQASLEIIGPFAYGFLKRETGVHRLVRISPFSSQSLRHTSFALVEVLPELPKTEMAAIEVKPDDLRIDTFRASGPGGQYVNRRESAVRVTHLPTGITVSCQVERLQGQNKDKAMKILMAKLHQLRLENSKKELKEIKGESISASWGNQIRSYVLHPYKLVKDLRTNIELSRAEKVLDGDLDEFIEAEIQLKNND